MKTVKKQRCFGYELLVDAYGCPFECCDSLDHAHYFLNELTRVLKMKRLCPPFLFRVQPISLHDPGGLTGCIPLSESNIQVHTVSRRQFVSLNVYSCKPFSVSLVKQFVQAHFSPTSMDCRLIKRGVRYATRNLRSP